MVGRHPPGAGLRLRSSAARHPHPAVPGGSASESRRGDGGLHDWFVSCTVSGPGRRPESRSDGCASASVDGSGCGWAGSARSLRCIAARLRRDGLSPARDASLRRAGMPVSDNRGIHPWKRPRCGARRCSAKTHSTVAEATMCSMAAAAATNSTAETGLDARPRVAREWSRDPGT